MLILDLISVQLSGCQLIFAFNLESIVVKILLASAYLLEYVFHYAKRAPSHENNCSQSNMLRICEVKEVYR